jgi:hypothetical protein
MIYSFKTMIILVIISGGIISILGDAAIRVVLYIFGLWDVSSPWYSVLLNPGWMVLDYLSGTVTVSIFLPFIIRKIRLGIQSQRDLVIWGMWMGLFAGICNSIILATLHLGIMSGLGEYGLASTIKLIGIYVPVTVFLFGLPAGIIGAIFGIIAAVFYGMFRKGVKSLDV